MKITSRVSGQGPKIILLHGYAGNVSHWRGVAHQLEKQYTVVVVNYAHLYLGRAAHSFSAQVDILGEWISTQFPSERVLIAGISFGGALGWGLGLKFPHLVSKLIFINPMMPTPGAQFHMTSMRLFFTIPLSRRSVAFFLATPIGAKFLKTCATLFRLQSAEQSERLVALEGRRRILVAHLFNNFAWILKQEQWAQWHSGFDSWSHPTLMIYDPQDPLFKRNAYFEFAQKVKSEKVVLLPGAGHIAIHTAAEQIAAEMIAFADESKHKKQVA